jgi:DNA-binding NtrC family response regulator
MKECVRQMQLVAPTKATVLLIGETGTGKGVLARLIHQHSHRQSGPFVSVHCGAIPDTLLESELFGHEKGAFTGASQRRLGKFEIANGGTIFLDEVGTLSPSAQIKLLQILQERVLQRVGGDAQIEVDVRVIAATNVDLQALCDAGTFRNDLFYRLNVFPVAVPPLRARAEDIPLLAETFLKRLNRQRAKVIRGVHPEVMTALQAYRWPGNVREMENLFERAHILEQTSLLSDRSFPAEVVHSAAGPALAAGPDTALTLDEFQQRAADTTRRQYLEAQLVAHRGRIDRTAEAAGISPRHLRKLMRRYALRKEAFRGPREEGAGAP